MNAERECLVQTVEVRFDGELHRASYYVENNIIHAQIDGHPVLSPLGKTPAADTVKVLLTEHLIQRKRVANQAERWLSRINHADNDRRA
jgi:bacterioferritin (cytochrome b1)